MDDLILYMVKPRDGIGREYCIAVLPENENLGNGLIHGRDAYGKVRTFDSRFWMWERAN